MRRLADPMRKRTLGITLVETLAAILIAVIVAGIAYPVVVQAVERSKQAPCMQNLKNIYMALQAYRADWEGPEEFPGAGWLPMMPIMYPHVLKPYVAAKRIACPLDRSPESSRFDISYEKNLANYESRFHGSDKYADSEISKRFVEARKALLEARGSEFPFMWCTRHDDGWHIDQAQRYRNWLRDPFGDVLTIQLRLDGSVKARRENIVGFGSDWVLP
jgi:type II secretory pathway pseudopilin PulG